MKNIKKIVIAVLLLTVLTIGTLIAIPYFSKPSEGLKLKKDDDVKLLLVKVLIMDKNKTPKSLTMDSTFDNDKYLANILYSNKMDFILTKDNNYYVLDLKTNVNKEVLNNMNDYAFAMNNNNGEVIKDVIFDKKNYIVKVPKKYYEADRSIPVQMEIQSRLTKNELVNLPVNVKIKNVFAHNKTLKLKGNDTISMFTIFNKQTSKKLNNKSLNVYVNEYTKFNKLNALSYKLDKNNGALAIYESPVFLTNIYVDVNKSLFDKFANMLSISNVEAYKYTDAPSNDYGPHRIKLSGNPNIAGNLSNKKGWFATNNVEVNYNEPGTWEGAMTDDIRNKLYWAWKLVNLEDYPSGGIYNRIESLLSGNEESIYRGDNPQLVEDDDILNSSGGIFSNLGYAKLPTKLYTGTGGDINNYTTLATTLTFPSPAEGEDTTDEQFVSLSCVHITTDSQFETNMPLWAYVFDYQEETNSSDGYMDVLYLTSKNVSTQTLYGVVRYYWPAIITKPGYIKVTKTFTKSYGATTDAVNEGNHYIFHAMKQDESISGCSGTPADRCKTACLTGTDYDTNTAAEGGYKIISWWDSAKTKPKKVEYYIGIPYESGNNGHSTGAAVLENGSRYCVWERYTTATDKYVTWSAPRLTGVHGDNDGTIVRISDSSDTVTTSNGTFKRVSVSATNRKKEYCVAAVKFDYDDQEKRLPNVTFGLYKDSDCTSKVTKTSSNTHWTETTGTNGIATFSGIMTSNTNLTSIPNELYVKEESMSGTTNDNYHINPNCHKVTVDKDGECNRKGVKNKKKYYCAKVMKKDSVTGNTLAGATFTTSRGALDTNTGAAVRYIFAGDKNTSIRVTETAAPDGYTLPNPNYKDVTPAQMVKCNPSGSTTCYQYAKELCLSTTTTDAEKFGSDATAATATITFNDSKLLLNWYKETEGNIGIGKAKFRVSYTTGSGSSTVRNYIKVKSNNGQLVKSSYNDGTTSKDCYEYLGTTTNKNEASIVESSASNSEGDVCITGLNINGSYLVEETAPAQYHTFDGATSKPINTSETFTAKAANKSNVFINQPTEVKFKKDVEGDANADEITKALNAAALKSIRFVITDSENNTYFFIKNNTTGKYVYYYRKIPAGSVDNRAVNKYDLPISNPQYTDATNYLILDSNNEIDITHLPEGTYKISEYGSTVNQDGTCDCSLDGNTCVPFSALKSTTTFTVTKCSSSAADTAANKAAGGVCENITTGVVNVKLTNKLTQLVFTKKDIYSYGDSDDVNGEAVDFVDSKERSDFDQIVFRVYAESDTSRSTPLRFIRLDDNITDSSNKCLNDNDYSIYRYVSDEMYNLLTPEQKSRVVLETDLHTCGGHIKIYGLCRGKKFTVVEESVPDNSVYVLQVDDNGKKPEVTYEIPCCDDTPPTPSTTTTVIKDTPTRVRIEKRDSKYNFLIDDETTTFELYMCEKGYEDVCHPSQSKEHMTLVKFYPRAIINGDNEDGGADDYENSYRVYRKVSDSDVKNMSKCSNGETGNNCYVTDLHTDHGVLVLRYLLSGYQYKLLETGNPQKYSLPEGTNKETTVTVVNNTANVESVDYPNVPVSLLVRKYNENGTNLLEGAEFKIHKATSCSTSVSPKNLVGETLKLHTVRDGIYENRLDGDTYIFKTCTDRDNALCSGINENLTYSKSQTEIQNQPNRFNYQNGFADFNNINNSQGEHPTIQAGEALIQYLDYDQCYVIEEVKAPEGYELPKNDDDRFILKQVTKKQEIVDTYQELKNKPTHYTFFKLDEYNRPLDGAKFKLQKLNNEKIYEDIPVTLETGESGKVYYRVDKNSNNFIIETSGGEATIYYLSEGQYRVLEVVAPEGYELPKKTINVAIFVVDEEGQIFGSSVITNKPKTEKINAYAEAKLIVNIQTGQTIIKYGLIIALIAIATFGLIYIQRKKK